MTQHPQQPMSLICVDFVFVKMIPVTGGWIVRQRLPIKVYSEVWSFFWNLQILLYFYFSIRFSQAQEIAKPPIYLDKADNHLSEDLILERLNRVRDMSFVHDDLHYFNFAGEIAHRKIVADFLTRHLNSTSPVDPNNVFVLNGAATVLNSIAKHLFEPGDILLIPTPVFSGVPKYLSNNTGVQVYGIPLQGKDFKLTASAVENAVLSLRSRGLPVKGFVLVNPSNPLGDVYSKELVTDLLFVCRRYGMHFISNEIFSLSVYDPSVKFHSALSIANDPDPQKTHIVWGFSKAFGVSGFRIGLLVTQNERLKTLVQRDAQLTAVPHFMTRISVTNLKEEAWIYNNYLPRVHRQLRDAANLVRITLEPYGIYFKPTSAGLYHWADFGNIMLSRNSSCERCLFNKFKEYGVILNKGSEFGSEFGWFRIVFATDPGLLREGLNRMVAALDYIKEARKNITQGLVTMTPMMMGCSGGHSDIMTDYRPQPSFQEIGGNSIGLIPLETSSQDKNHVMPIIQPQYTYPISSMVVNPFPQYQQYATASSEINPLPQSESTKPSDGGIFSFVSKPISVGKWILSRAFNFLLTSNWNPSNEK